ncbi:MAG: DNA alkylation repair protein [Clostridiales bacterium]|nr:DNA alkylation repair protein [Clostridiales bacterium]
MTLREQLETQKDEKFKKFNSKLLPEIDENKITGVKTPVIRNIAKNASEAEAEEFLNELPHKTFEENNLHAFLIEKIKDFDKALEKTEEFLPHVDNWATCDTFFPKVFAKNKEKILPFAYKWIDSGETYKIRYGIGVLMKLFLGKDYKEEYAEKVCSVKSGEYYVNMMRAWYFATALAKNYESAVKFLEQKKLDAWTNNKTVRKACESFRIDDKTKEYLKTLKM